VRRDHWASTAFAADVNIQMEGKDTVSHLCHHHFQLRILLHAQLRKSRSSTPWQSEVSHRRTHGSKLLDLSVLENAHLRSRYLHRWGSALFERERLHKHVKTQSPSVRDDHELRFIRHNGSPLQQQVKGLVSVGPVEYLREGKQRPPLADQVSQCMPSLACATAPSF
jgi:hypothetical protein